MKKNIVFILAFLVLVSGCAAVGNFFNDRKADWNACLSDLGPDGVKDTGDECYAHAKAWQDKMETVSTIVAAAVPVPGAAAAPKIIGYGSFGLAMLLLGHALRKKVPA